MKKELDEQKRKEIQRYIQLLKQQEEKVLTNLSMGKLQNEVLKMYKKSNDINVEKVLENYKK